MKRCKHQNGELFEWVEAYHTRDVIDGEVTQDGVNDLGNIQGYTYCCRDCGKAFSYQPPPRQKWLQKIHGQLGGKAER